MGAPRVSLDDADFERTGNLLRADSDLPRGAVLRLGSAAFRQGSPIESLAISRDGQFVATSGYEQGAPVILRERKTRRAVHYLADDKLGSASLAFSPDGTLLAAGSNRDRTVRVWDTASGRRIQLLRTTAYPDKVGEYPTYVDFSSDGSTVVTGSPDGYVQLWDVLEGRETGRVAIPANMQGRRAAIVGLVAAHVGSMVAVATADGTVRLYEMPEGKPVQQFETAPMHVTRMSFSENGEQLACILNGPPRSLIAGEGLFIWDVKQNKRLITLVKPSEYGYGEVVAISPKGDRLAAGSSVGSAARIVIARTLPNGTDKA